MRRFTSALFVAALVTTLFGAGPVEAQAPTGTVVIEIDEASGSYATGFCLQPATLVVGSFTCSDGSSQHIDFVNAGGTATRALAPGTYTAGIASMSPLALGGSGTVTVVAGQTITCSFTLAGGPDCGGTPVTTATLLISVDAASGSYATGFCPSPQLPVLGSTTCSGGASANVDFFGAGEIAVRSLSPGLYNAGVASISPLSSGASGAVTVAAGDVLECTFSMTVAPSCADLDANGDGTPDATQPHVASVVAADGRSLVTIEAEDAGYAISDVVSLGAPASPAPPQPLPVGLVGFTVTLPSGESTAEVDLTFPDGTGPTGYLKLRSGAWVDISSQATISGDVVTLTLVDNDALDTDPTVGVIGDPGGPTVALVPPSRDACKRDGWRGYTDRRGGSFRNQGDCVSWVATGGSNPAG